MKPWNAIIGNEELNTGRHVELDIARGIAVAIMIFGNSFETFAGDALMSTPACRILDKIINPMAAPVFMFLMGAGIICSRKTDPVSLFRKGATYILYGYILSFFRFFLPVLIGLKSGYLKTDMLDDPLSFYLLEIDIFQLAGLSLIFMSFLSLIKLDNKYRFATALVIAAASPYLWGLYTGNHFVNQLLDPLWGNDEITSFPFFPWAFYPICGSCFGYLLLRTTDKRAFYGRLSVYALPVLISGLALSYFNRKFFIGDYWRHGLGACLIILSYIIFSLYFYFSILKFLPKFVTRKLSQWSRYVTVLYVIHWLIIGWAYVLTKMAGHWTWTVITIGVVNIFVSDRVMYYYFKIMRSPAMKKIPFFSGAKSAGPGGKC